MSYDLKMECKDGEDWSRNRIDLELKGGMLQKVTGINQLTQAIKKVILSPLYSSGYATDISFLRGKKMILSKLLIRIRIIRSLLMIKRMYDVDIEPTDITITQEKDLIKINFNIKGENFTIEV